MTKKNRHDEKSENKSGSGKAEEDTVESRSHFIKEIIDKDMESDKCEGRVVTRFPPEPNGYLHIGHAKSICLNFGIAAEYGGVCNLRFDDTNPSTEDAEYVNSIIDDIRWLGFDWKSRLFYASEYFEKFYEHAVYLIKKGAAYVDSLGADEIRRLRGDFNTPGKNSPYRDRSIEENLDLLERMRAGEFDEGTNVLRAKIDMKSPNMNMRDPVIYRIRKASHHRTGDKWCIYPMYDFAHGLEDSIEGITHSLCSLEFENHRPLYDWFLDELEVECHPQQIEFARLNLSYTVMSKRKLLELVEAGLVNGWDDPRMPTISGMRRRGYTPESIRKFCERIGVAKRDNVVDVALLEHTLREDLNDRSPRVMGVLRPLKVVIDNYPEGETEEFHAPFHPEDESMGSRMVPFSRVLYVERDDFREEAPRKWHRLAPGREVRLRYACLITCVDVVKDENTGEVVELHCTWDPESRGGTSPDGRKVRGTLHWVSAAHAIQAEVRLYDRLFNKANPLDSKDGADFKDHINPNALEVLPACLLEPSLKDAEPGSRCQFERLGYFCVDSVDSKPDKLVFNRTVTLRDSWAKIERSLGRSGASGKQGSKGKGGGTKKQTDSKQGKQIAIDDFAKLDFRVALVREAGFVEGADRLLRLVVDLGEGRTRQILSGIREGYPDPGKLVGKKVIVLANLKPRKMKFGVSEGMVITGEGGDRLAVATFLGDLEPGDKVS
ncbi:MAG: glutamine--tRNA ligase/YqeY domain fusion protein [Deltaproteobacteria bacterium]|nr:glutamine--tRNA ligase/YqeY domain fusion protein [Deltaproteobacteria bacterium]